MDTNLIVESYACTFEDFSKQPVQYHPGVLKIIYPKTKEAAKKNNMQLNSTNIEFISNSNIKMFKFLLNKTTSLQSSKQNPKLRIKDDSKDNLSYTLKFVNNDVRDTAKNKLTRRIEETKKPKKTPNDAKRSVLISSQILKESHLELVINKKIMTEEEFFELPDVKQELLKQKQKNLELGMLNDVISEVRRRLQRLQPGESVSLPSHIIANILEAYPTVRASYEMWVPHKFSEEKFWEMFCHSTLVHYENPNIARDDQFLSIHREKVESFRNKISKDHQINKKVDVHKNETNTLFGEIIEIEDNAPRKEVNELDKLHDINMHSNCIIHSTLKEDIVQDDQDEILYGKFLEINDDDNLENLQIEDKRSYFELRRNTSNQIDESRKTELNQIRNNLLNNVNELAQRDSIFSDSSNWESSFSPNENQNVLNDLERKAQISGTPTIESNHDQETINKIKNHFIIVNQLLRPLWHSIQVRHALTNLQKSKIPLIIEELKKKKEELKNERMSRSSVGGIINPIIHTIDIALEKADQVGLLATVQEKKTIKTEAPIKQEKKTFTMSFA